MTEVVGSPGADASTHRPLNFTKPKADTYSTEDMLPARPRTGLGVIMVSVVILIVVAASWVGKLKAPPPAVPLAPVSSTATPSNPAAGAKADKPAPRSPAKSSAARPKKEKPVKAAAAPSARENPSVEDYAGDTGDMSLEQFRKLSGKI